MLWRLLSSTRDGDCLVSRSTGMTNQSRCLRSTARPSPFGKFDLKRRLVGAYIDPPATPALDLRCSSRSERNVHVDYLIIVKPEKAQQSPDYPCQPTSAFSQVASPSLLPWYFEPIEPCDDACSGIYVKCAFTPAY